VHQAFRKLAFCESSVWVCERCVPFISEFNKTRRFGIDISGLDVLGIGARAFMFRSALIHCSRCSLWRMFRPGKLEVRNFV
jgi:hypothetical protein